MGKGVLCVVLLLICSRIGSGLIREGGIGNSLRSIGRGLFGGSLSIGISFSIGGSCISDISGISLFFIDDFLSG